MDLTTTYMGLKLKNPIVASPSPVSENVDACKRLEDAGISAIVLSSLFEEQIINEDQTMQEMLSVGTQSYAEALTYFPAPGDFIRGPEEYLEHIRKVKKAVSVPVIGSLNGHTLGGWGEYARHIQDAGADALELNIYLLATDPNVPGSKVEDNYLEIVRQVKSKVSIPVAVKLSPYFSSIAAMAQRLDAAGVNGLVLFNRFYQPDIDLESLEVLPDLKLSSVNEMRLPLRWIAILYSHVRASLAATSGIYEAQDAIKVLMAGADVAMVCATIFKGGIGQVGRMITTMQNWMQTHEYESVSQLKGSMSQKTCGNPEAFERANYMKSLLSYHHHG